jgi:hypothetical protein
MQNAAGPAFLADCPTRLAVEIIADKWAAPSSTSRRQ